jgi:hypothetical protein
MHSPLAIDVGHTGAVVVVILFVGAVLIGCLLLTSIFVRPVLSRAAYIAALALLALVVLLLDFKGFAGLVLSPNRIGDPFVTLWWATLALFPYAPYMRRRRRSR